MNKGEEIGTKTPVAMVHRLLKSSQSHHGHRLLLGICVWENACIEKSKNSKKWCVVGFKSQVKSVLSVWGSRRGFKKPNSFKMSNEFPTLLVK